jgi:hypothetical protein
MNKQRRTELRKIACDLANITTKEQIEDCINDIENLKFEEEMFYDRAPENLQYSRRYMDSEYAINYMDDALSSLNDALECDEDGFKININKAIKELRSAAV